jgi:hypothetical protein
MAKPKGRHERVSFLCVVFRCHVLNPVVGWQIRQHKKWQPRKRTKSSTIYSTKATPPEIKPQNRSLHPEDEFPYWNPLHNDEDDWKTK